MNYLYKISFSFLAFNLLLPNKQKMGQTLQKLGSEESKDINPIIDECYHKYFAADPNKDWTTADFYHAICDTVEEINKMLGTTQFHVPDSATLEVAYKATYGQINVIQRLIRYSGESCDLQKHHRGKGKSLTKEEFEKIFQDVILGTGVTGIGMKDLLFYLFGVPVTALFLKQRLIPNALPNEVFIPGVTSATVFLLAKLNKI